MRNRLRRMGGSFQPRREPFSPIDRAALGAEVRRRLEEACREAAAEPGHRPFVAPFPRAPGESHRSYLARLVEDESAQKAGAGGGPGDGDEPG